MSEVQEAVVECLWHLDEAMEQRGWDEPSHLLMVRTTMTDEKGYVLMEPVFGWHRFAAAGQSPQEALAMVAAAYGSMPQDLLLAGIPSDLFGVAFVTEGWSISAPLDDAAALIEEVDGARVQDLPNRVEIRMVYLQPVAGEPVLLQHERDGLVEIVDGAHAGAVPRLLEKVVAAMTR